MAPPRLSPEHVAAGGEFVKEGYTSPIQNTKGGGEEN